jgi:hypothetical protein
LTARWRWAPQPGLLPFVKPSFAREYLNEEQILLKKKILQFTTNPAFARMPSCTPLRMSRVVRKPRAKT